MEDPVLNIVDLTHLSMPEARALGRTLNDIIQKAYESGHHVGWKEGIDQAYNSVNETLAIGGMPISFTWEEEPSHD